MSCTLCPRRCDVERDFDREPLDSAMEIPSCGTKSAAKESAQTGLSRALGRGPETDGDRKSNVGGGAGTARRGVCGMGAQVRVARAALHFWEEPCISGTRGSGAVFFSGCGLRCAFCQNEEISHGGVGEVVSVRRLADIFRELEDQGAHNINLVTAAHFAPAVLKALDIYRPRIPIVYNSSGYESIETLRLLEGIIDIYLPDYKYIDSAMARLLSGAADYPQVAWEAIREMRRQTGPAVYDADGMMLRGTQIRHLLLPGLTGDAMRILTAIADELPDTPVSLMGQYVPCGRALSIPGMNRRVTRREYERVAAHMRLLNLPGYIQELESASDAFVPAFDGTGVRAVPAPISEQL